jgi:hypothetical protein
MERTARHDDVTTSESRGVSALSKQAGPQSAHRKETDQRFAWRDNQIRDLRGDEPSRPTA